MNKKNDINNIVSKYDENTRLLYTYIAKKERETASKRKRQDVRDDIKQAIEKVIK